MNFVLEKFDAPIKLKSGNFFALSSFELIRGIAFLSSFILGNISYVIYGVLLAISFIVFIYNCKYYYSRLNSFQNYDLEIYDICSNSYLSIIIINSLIFLLMTLALFNIIIFTLLIIAILIEYVYIGVRCLYLRHKVIKYIDFMIMHKGI